MVLELTNKRTKQMNKQALCPLSVLILLIFILFSFPAVGFETRSMDLSEGWEYRWGDSPFEQGVPTWTTNKEPEQWKAIGFPSNPPDRQGRNNIWYRVSLPDQPDLGQSLYIFSIDLIAEVYMDGERIYHFGHFKPDGTGTFEGWPWHIITLPRSYPGRSLYFRIYSDYPDIGLWGKVVLGNEGNHLKKIIQNDLPSVSVGVFFVFFGVLLLVLSVFRLSRPVLLIGLLWVNLGLMPIDTSHVKQLILFAPLGWQYFGAANYFLLPVTMAALVHTMFGKGFWKINQLVWQIHLVFLVVSMAASYTGLINLSSTYIYFDGLALVTLAILTITLFLQARKGHSNQKILSAGFWVMYFILLYNGLVAHDVLPFSASSEYIGPMFLAFCFGLIMLREYSDLKIRLKLRTQELLDLNHTLESRIAIRTQELQHSNNTKDQFFTIIAHDLKGPVGSLAMLLQHFAEHTYSIDQEILERMSESSSRTYELLENLLTWARSQKGELKANPSHFDLGKETEAAIALIANIANEKNIFLDFSYQPSFFGYADQSMVETVIRNLVHNAIKFSNAGDTVHISIKPTEKQLAIYVKDQGLGMDAEKVNTLFDIQAGNKSLKGTSGEKGTGLGLLLCKEFIELNGGKISVFSVKGEGTEFQFTIPRGTPPTASHIEQSLGLHAWMVGKKVLLVEDNPLHQQTTTEQLKHFEVEVLLAENTEQALAIFKEQEIDLILMDITLPGENGITGTLKMQQTGKPLPPTFALTSFSQVELEQQFDNLPFDGFLSKPLVIADFISVFRHMNLRATDNR